MKTCRIKLPDKKDSDFLCITLLKSQLDLMDLEIYFRKI